MALTADRPYETSGAMSAIRVKMTTNDIYYKGAIVNVTAAGGLGIVASDTANQGVLSGIVTKQLDNTGKTEYAEIEIGKVWIPDTNAAQADVGDYCYATADDTIAMSAANADPCGIVVDVRVGICAVLLQRIGSFRTHREVGRWPGIAQRLPTRKRLKIPASDERKQ